MTDMMYCDDGEHGWGWKNLNISVLKMKMYLRVVSDEMAGTRSAIPSLSGDDEGPGAVR